MRIFLIWGSRCDRVEPLVSRLQSRGHKILYWTGVGEGQASLADGIFQHHYQAYDGLPAPGFRIDQFPPPSKEFIKRHSQLEQFILSMMNKRFDSLCVDERKHIYYNLLQYWQGILTEYKPEVIIFSTIPHSVYDHVIYQLAKDRGIKTIMFEESWVSDRLLMYNDWQQGSRALLAAIEKNRDKNFSLQEISGDLQEYYQRQINPHSNVTPIYMSIWKKEYSGKKVFYNRLKILITSIIDGTVFRKVYRHLKRELGPNLKREYRPLETKPDFNQPFIYAPLGFQPERTNVMGDVFSDQILMLKTLSYCLPEGWLLFVKEHPSQWWLRSRTRYSSARYPGYYRRVAQIKGVRLLPIDTDTHELIRRSKAVATVTGTAGWEGLFQGKPALVFGYPWFKDCPGVFRVDGVETTQAALNKISQGFTVERKEIINYLKCLDQATIHGYLGPLLEKVSRLTPKESIENIAKVILSEIEEDLPS